MTDETNTEPVTPDLDELLPTGDLVVPDQQEDEIDLALPVGDLSPGSESESAEQDTDVEDAAADVPAGIDPETGEILDEDDIIEERPALESPYDRPGKWFVVHTQSGYENKVK